jgi:lipopolysaccharide export system protein LptA
MVCKFHAAMTAFVSPSLRLMVNPHAALAAVLAALCLVAAPAFAEKADRYQPLHYEGDRAEADGLKQVYTLKGNVIITKGTIQIRSDQAQIRQSPEGYASAVVTASGGKLAQFRQKREGTAETIEGEAERIEYDARSDTVRFVNRAVLRRYRGQALADEVTGNLITYDNTTEVFQALGAPSAPSEAASAPTGRVRGVLAPRQSASAPEASSPPGERR